MSDGSKTPRHWRLPSQLVFVLVFLVLAPIAVVVWINAREVERQSLQRETVALEHRAAEAARRLEERVGRLRAYVEHVATNPAILSAVDTAPVKGGDVLAKAEAWDEGHPEIHELLVSVRNANPWFRNVYLLSESGVCISASERDRTPAMVGRVYDYRPYFRAPIDNAEPFVSDLLKNATSSGTGIFVSAPILKNGEVLAVAVLKVDSFALHDVVADLSQRAGRALLVDRFGVVVSDALDGQVQTVDKPGSIQFRPLTDVGRYVPRFEETKRYGDPSGENYLDRIAKPLGLDDLWSALRTQASGASEFPLTDEAEAEQVPSMMGYSPVWSLTSEPYGYVVLAEPAASFREPLLDLGRDALIRFAVVMVAIGILSLLFIRRVGVRLRALERSAGAAKSEPHAKAAPPSSQSGPARAAIIDRLIRRVRAPLSEAEHQLEKLSSEEANEAANRLSEARDQLDGILLLAPGEPKIAMQRRRFELQALLEEVVEHARPAAELHETKVTLKSDDLGEITSDRRKLALVLGNLLSNACQYTRRGSVTVTAKRDEDGFTITIEDDGIGMTQRQIERVTDPFADESGDVPLGVVVAVRGSQLLGGSLELTSAPDEGTTVVVRLPLR